MSADDLQDPRLWPPRPRKRTSSPSAALARRRPTPPATRAPALPAHPRSRPSAPKSERCSRDMLASMAKSLQSLLALSIYPAVLGGACGPWASSFAAAWTRRWPPWAPSSA